MTSRCHHRPVDSPLFFRKTVENERYRWPPWPSLCLMEWNPRQSWTARLYFVYSGFQSLSVELGFRISMFRGIPYSLSSIPDSKAQDSGPNRQKSFGFWIPQATIWWILESDSLIWCVSPAWRWLSHLLRGPGTVWEEALNPDARLLGKVETS